MPSTKNAPEKLRPFLFHGVDIAPGETASSGDCPFCHKEGRFTIVTATGQWRCVRCDSSGNIYNFLSQLHIDSLGQTTENDYEDLAIIKDIRASTLRAWGLAKSILTGEWLVPCYNDKDALGNLYRIAEMDGKLRPLSTPGCKAHPFGIRTLKSSQTRRLVCEGLWDGMRMYDVLSTHRLSGGRYMRTTDSSQSMLRTMGVFAVPGSNTFGDSAACHLSEFDGVIAFDNDHPTKHPVTKELIRRKGNLVIPGWDGQQSAILTCQKSKDRPRSLVQLRWHDTEPYDPSLSSGFDLSDLISRDGAIGALKFIENHLESVQIKSGTSPRKGEPDDVPIIDPIPRETFDQLCADYGNALHFSSEMRDCLAVSLALVLSTDLPGEQLWLRVIGPPGSGKTTIAEAITVAREFTMPSSIFTGFHSGYIGNGEEREQGNSSLVPKMHGKTVIIKDGDTLVNSSSKDRVLSELRDIYDGTTRATYRNRKSDNFENLRITFLLCGTQQLRQLDRSSLGERFLSIEIIGKGTSTAPYLNKALDNAYSALVSGLSNNEEDNEARGDKLLVVKAATYGLIQHLKNNLRGRKPPALPVKQGNRIKALAEYVACMRARVTREGHEIAYRPDVELPTRLVHQLTRLSVCLALVLNKAEVDDEIIRIVRKVVNDTCKSLQSEVAGSLYKNPKGLSVTQVALFLGLPETSVRRWLNDMREFSIVRRVAKSNNSGQRGRDVHLFQLSPAQQELWDRAWK